MHAIAQLAPDELRSALAILLATPATGRAATSRQVAGFCDYLAYGLVEWAGWRCGQPAAPTGLLLALILPGHTALTMLPAPGQLGITPEGERAVLDHALNELSARPLHYMQALLEPQATAARALLLDAGFDCLAPLVYLERNATFPWVPPPAPDQAEWLLYSAKTHARFAAVVQATYEGSLDCPELTGLRPIDDVLAAHQAAGQFDPALWELARIDGRDAGCLLMARLPHGHMLELVYMGVVPTFRRRGVGRLLLRGALEHCRVTRARQLTVVVDDRNTPARELYARFGLAPVAQRDAYLYRLPHG